MACAMGARVEGKEEGARAATAGRAQAEVCAKEGEAGGAAAATASEDAGQAAGRALKEAAARRLQGKAEGWGEERYGWGEGRSVEGGSGRRTVRGGKCGRGRTGGVVENVRQETAEGEVLKIVCVVLS